MATRVFEHSGPRRDSPVCMQDRFGNSAHAEALARSDLRVTCSAQSQGGDVR